MKYPLKRMMIASEKNFTVLFIQVGIVFFFYISQANSTSPRWSIPWEIPESQQTTAPVENEPEIEEEINPQQYFVPPPFVDLWYETRSEDVINNTTSNFSDLYSVNAYKYNLIKELVTKDASVQFLEFALKTGHAKYVEEVLKDQETKFPETYAKALYLSGRDNPFIDARIRANIDRSDYSPIVLRYRVFNNPRISPREKLLAAETLEQYGLIRTAELRKLYNQYSSAESGGVWGRIAVFQSVLKRKDIDSVHQYLNVAFADRRIPQMIRLIANDSKIYSYIERFPFYLMASEYKKAIDNPVPYREALPDASGYLQNKQYGLAILEALKIFEKDTQVTMNTLQGALSILVLCGQKGKAIEIAKELSFLRHNITTLSATEFSYGL